MGRFTASIDDEIQEQLDDYAKANGYNRSEALELILRKHFEEDSQPSPEAPAQPVPAPPPDDLTNYDESIDVIQREAMLKEQYLSELYLSLERMRAEMEMNWELLFEDYEANPMLQLPVPPWMEDQDPY